MTIEYWGAAERPSASGDRVRVGVWWQQSWGCPALHYEEDIPLVIGCDEDWDGAFGTGPGFLRPQRPQT